MVWNEFHKIDVSVCRYSQTSLLDSSLHLHTIS